MTTTAQALAAISAAYTLRFTCPACRYTTTDAYTVEVISTIDEQCPQCSAELDPYSISGLSAGWERSSDEVLGELLSEFSEPFLTDADYSLVIDELDKRTAEHLATLPPR